MEISEKLSSFLPIDYVVLIGMLSMCTTVGMFFGYKDYKKRKENSHQSIHNADDYLLGGRQMNILPISLSLVATYLSGISLLGLSSEVYVSSYRMFETI